MFAHAQSLGFATYRGLRVRRHPRLLPRLQPNTAYRCTYQRATRRSFRVQYGSGRGRCVRRVSTGERLSACCKRASRGWCWWGSEGLDRGTEGVGTECGRELSCVLDDLYIGAGGQCVVFGCVYIKRCGVVYDLMGRKQRYAHEMLRYFYCEEDCKLSSRSFLSLATNVALIMSTGVGGQPARERQSRGDVQASI